MNKINIILCFTVSLAAFSQEAAVTRDAENANAYKIEMPAAPAWQTFLNGKSVARVAINIPGAAACRIEFDYLGLAAGEELFVHAVDPKSGVVSHGPYTGHGPLNRADFATLWLPGPRFYVEAIGAPTADFPFVLSGAQCVEASDEAAQGIRFQARFKPAAAPAPGLRSVAPFGDALVPVEVRDGSAVTEGDIVVETEEQASGKGPRQAVATNVKTNAWPKFQVPYSPGSAYNTEIIRVEDDYEVSTAIYSWNQLLPGILKPVTSEADYIAFKRIPGVCQSHVGRAGGKQIISLDAHCSASAVMHEIAHAIGLWHEQQRPDRDQYVKINVANVDPDKVNNFNKVSATNTKTTGAYDFKSLMHYSAYAFSINGKPTIEPLTPLPAGVTMGGKIPTSTDIAAVKGLVCSMWYTAPTLPAVDAEGGSFLLTINVPSYCPWTVTESVTWVSLSKTSGTGPANITVNVSASNLLHNRLTTITINGQAKTLTQYGWN